MIMCLCVSDILYKSCQESINEIDGDDIIRGRRLENKNSNLWR